MDAAAHFPLLLPNGIYLIARESNSRVAPYSLIPEQSILSSVPRALGVYFQYRWDVRSSPIAAQYDPIANWDRST